VGGREECQDVVEWMGMRFDLDVAKSLLEFIEESDRYPNPVIHTRSKSQIKLLDPEVTRREISYHLERMIEAGFVDAKRSMSKDGAQFFIYGLTMEGHTFLEHARCKGVWETVKEKLSDVNSFSIDLVKTLLVDYAKKVVVGT